MEYITSVERIGIRKGRRERTTNGETTILSRQLEKKFGRLPAEYVVRLKAADEKNLLNWADRILTAKSLHEVFS